MVRVVAKAGFDSRRIDLGIYDRDQSDEAFHDDLGFRLGRRSYDDLYTVDAVDPDIDRVFGVVGRNFSEDSDGDVHGKVRGMFESSAGETLWFADGFSVSAGAFDRASQTARLADDRALFSAILSGDDVFRLGAGRDRIEAGSGDDVVRAAGGRDVIKAGHGSDQVFGGRGHDRLMGQAGADQLNGGGGNDRLVGGRGPDTFVFSGRFGNDLIRDFDPDRDGDQIDLSRVAGISGFRDLRLHHLDQDGDDAVITADNGGTITLHDLSPGDLSASAFIF